MLEILSSEILAEVVATHEVLGLLSILDFLTLVTAIELPKDLEGAGTLSKDIALEFLEKLPKLQGLSCLGFVFNLCQVSVTPET